MYNAVLLDNNPEDWYCPNCQLTDRVPAPLPATATRFHNCPGLHDLAAPMIRGGVDAKVEAIEREDYLGGDTQAMGSDGKVYMAVETTRVDGTDRAVNAGLAHGEMRV